MKGLKEADLFSDESLDILDLAPANSVPLAWTSRLSSYFSELSLQELLYKPDIHCFAAQPEITPTMRSILLTWLMEVSASFRLKRETFYKAISTLDRFLSICTVKKDDLQLVGCACLYIACKMEEVLGPPVADFVTAAAESFTVRDIIIKENLILRNLKWQMYPVTYFNWLNALLEEWDKYFLFLFADCIPLIHLSADRISRAVVTFKQKNKHAYCRFHECMELLDVCALDFKIYKFRPVTLVAAIVYLMVNRAFLNSNYEILPQREEMHEVFDCTVIVEQMLAQFLAATVQVSIENLVPEITFVESFRNFPFQNCEEEFEMAAGVVRNI
jgi:hypothetical protein